MRLRVRTGWGLAIVAVPFFFAGCGGAQEPQSPQPSPAQPRATDSGAGAELASSDAELEDPAQRAAAIARLIEAYDKAAANGTRTEPALAFVEAHGSALTSAYVEGRSSLEPKLRLSLLNLLVSFDDPRTVPALALAIDEYAKTAAGIDEAIWACQAAKKLRDPRLAPALMRAFDALDMSDKDGRRFSVHLEQAMLFNAIAAWAPTLRAKLEQPIVRPERFDDKPGVRAFNNQRFWQITSAKLLAELEDKEAARVVLRVTLDPEKRDVHLEANRTLMRLGRTTVELAHRLLEASDPELVELARQARPESEQANVVVAARILEELAPPSSRQRLIDAWEQSRSEDLRVLLARALMRLPKSERTVDILKQTYERTRAQTTLPEGEGGLEALARAAVLSFDHQMADWLGKKASRVPGKGARRADVQRALILSASELMLADQVKGLTPAAEKYGGRVGTPAFEESAALTGRCMALADCYAKVFIEGAGAAEPTSTTVKAVTMVGVLSTGVERDALLGALGDIKHPELANRVGEVIAHLTPQYDAGVAEALAARLKGENNPALVIAFERALFRIQARR